MSLTLLCEIIFCKIDFNKYELIIKRSKLFLMCFVVYQLCLMQAVSQICRLFAFIDIAKTPTKNVENFLVVKSGRKW
jgi:hypothetical protein